jgi:CubicO group peptidase (beta-lactamase class C family)
MWRATLVALVVLAFVPSIEYQLDEKIPKLLAEYRVPGAAVTVISDGEITLARGYGVLRAGGETKVTERTVFQAASLSKPVFAYGVHLLAREGILDLDRSLSEYLDEPYVEDERVSRITARMVLSHSTGFPNWRPRRWTDDPGALEIEFDPGTRFQYSGEGYVYLQRVVEKLTGESLDVYLRRAVLEPLGMTESTYVWEERLEEIPASPHDGEGVPQRKWRPREALASGTLQTTALDYARFLKALLVDSELVGAMLVPEIRIDDELSWSLGMGVETAGNERFFWQWGDDDTFKALAAGSRSNGAAVVVFTNGVWGLDVARPVVELVLGPRRFLDFRLLDYRN